MACKCPPNATGVWCVDENCRNNPAPDARPTLPVTKRRADTLNLVFEGRVQSRRTFTGREYRLVGGPVGWWAPAKVNLAEFDAAGLLAHADTDNVLDWSDVSVTRSGDYLWSLWKRDRDERSAARERVDIMAEAIARTQHGLDNNRREPTTDEEWRDIWELVYTDRVRAKFRDLAHVAIDLIHEGR